MASIPQYPRGTLASGLPDPDAFLTPSNPQQHPGELELHTQHDPGGGGSTRRNTARGGSTRRNTASGSSTRRNMASGSSTRRNTMSDCTRRSTSRNGTRRNTRRSWANRPSSPLHSRRRTQQAVPDDGGFLSASESGGSGGSKTRDPATLWGERGLGRYRTRV
ncbi:hypothetical protein NDU88_003014 [Pleurodeles waltl]|uniref:Uncharacterized protein n=1 Tax=Pleurodeles waltl TaxID=8319 RepID=A0AAV7V129_PLEWA|nr:hypothetical protein NDU88_003014 [Pleurodeles waltl]